VLKSIVTLIIAISLYCPSPLVQSFCIQQLGVQPYRSYTKFPAQTLLKLQPRKDAASKILQVQRQRQMQIGDGDCNRNEKVTDDNSQSDLDELFSVAPMMGHTNRHYRYFFRLLSAKTHLYTEMIPASQIWSAYRRAKEIYLPDFSSSQTSKEIPQPEEIMNVITRVIQDPIREYTATAHFGDSIPTLHQLLATSSTSSCSISKGISENPVSLQLGGNDPTTLSVASTIVAAWGAAESLVAGLSTISPTYTSINLNCGCPSYASGGTSGSSGCILMGTPDLVATSVDSMKKSIDKLWHTLEETKSSPTVTVKHRLGIREAATFDAPLDRLKNDNEAFTETSSFVRTVSLAGAVSKFHVHTRLGLLGDFLENNDVTEDSADDKVRTKQQLYIPRTTLNSLANIDSDSTFSDGPRVKIDHKREQEQARRRSRRAKIKNRDVPPLRPGVVPRLADAFPHLQFVANGGIEDLDHVKKIIDESQQGVIGAMVGRAVINHPCSFASADTVLWGSENQAVTPSPMRGQVLDDYIIYCEREEELLKSYGANPSQLEYLRRRLVAVPFHLFTGEEGSDEFQRRLKKLRDTKIGRTNQFQKKKNKKNKIVMKAASILRAAASFVPRETLDKSVDDSIPWKDVTKFEGGLKRGSALQRVVY